MLTGLAAAQAARRRASPVAGKVFMALPVLGEV
jgi:hypothetical protein